MNPLSQISKSLVRKSGEASAAPFYSAIDKSLSSLPNKALGDQFIKEMLKSGVKPQEIIDRNIDVILGSPIVKKTRTVKLKKPDKKGRTEIEEKYFEVTPSAKGSKAIKREDVERIAAENPPPSITEKVEKGPSEIKYKVEHDDLNDRYDVVDDYSNVVKSFRDYDDAESYATKLTGGTTRHEKWQLPGGKNYREIKLMLPVNKSYEKVNQLTEQANRLDQKAMSAWTQHGNLEEYKRLSGEARDLRLQANSIEKDIKDETFKYQSMHFDEPNILAHARVSDRTGPNGEKILHVEEIQSDWHQTGRKKGYAPKDAEAQLKAGEERMAQRGEEIRQERKFHGMRAAARTTHDAVRAAEHQRAERHRREAAAPQRHARREPEFARRQIDQQAAGHEEREDVGVEHAVDGQALVVGLQDRREGRVGVDAAVVERLERADHRPDHQGREAPDQEGQHRAPLRRQDVSGCGDGSRQRAGDRGGGHAGSPVTTMRPSMP